MNAPKITVILGIYNCAETLAESIDSLLAQTYNDWNLVMCDDGSIDETYEVAEKYRSDYPDRIKLIKNERNMGLNHTLNRCLELADGEYIARQDGDDISLPSRFEKEAAALDAHPEIAVVSTAMSYFDENGTWGQNHPIEFPQNNDFIDGTPFCHAPAMVRREAYMKVGGYTVDKKLLRVEDYDLWVKMYALRYRGMNLSEPLYAMRDDRNAYARRKFKYRINEFHVRIKAAKMLKLPFKAYICAFRPVIVGLLPTSAYNFLHKKRLEKNK